MIWAWKWYVTYVYKKTRRKHSCHKNTLVLPSAGKSEIFILKGTTQINVCPSIQRPTLPIRHKNSQKNTALSLYCPSCRQRALHWQVDDKTTTARQGSPGRRGEREENGPSKWSKGGSVQREQIYILINKTTICMTLEEVSAQRGSRMDTSGVGGGGGGFYLTRMVGK